MTQINWWLVLVAVLAGVIVTLLWSLRAVTRKVSVDDLPPAPIAAAAESEVTAAEPVTMPPSSDPAETLAPIPVAEATGDIAASTTVVVPEAHPHSRGSLDDISWWDRAFVANRPAPAISPSERESAARTRPSANRELLGPAGERIKGNRDTMLYHTIASPYYGRTKADEWFTSEAAAEEAGFTRWDRRRATQTITEPATGSDTAVPPPTQPNPSPLRNGKTVRNGKAAHNGKKLRNGTIGATIKGNRGSMLYHTVESPYYGRTKAEEWFSSEADAAAAGYQRWDHKRARN